MTHELLGVLKAGGGQVMSFGLKVADNRVLKSMRKGTTVEQMERTLAMVYRSGISLEGAFISAISPKPGRPPPTRSTGGALTPNTAST